VSGAGGLHYDRYFVAGQAEWLARVGPADGAPILFVPPLFEEMNRTRAFTVAVMRALAANGCHCWLPDLPGTGESERALEDCIWEDWTAAIQSAADEARFSGKLMVASLRGGALLDDIADAAHWQFAPVDGASLLRDLSRSGLVGGDNLAGYPASPRLAAALEEAVVPAVAPCRTVRLGSDPRSANAKLNGPTLWRRSEPASSAELAGLVAADIVDWARQCASS
jgi:hypothetical protein